MMSSIAIATLVNMHDALRIVLIALGFIIAIFGLHFCIIIEKDAGYYECKHCQHKYIPTFAQIYFCPHIGRTRYMKCPKCNKKSWQKKTISKD